MITFLTCTYIVILQLRYGCRTASPVNLFLARPEPKQFDFSSARAISPEYILGLVHLLMRSVWFFSLAKRDATAGGN